MSIIELLFITLIDLLVRRASTLLAMYIVFQVNKIEPKNEKKWKKLIFFEMAGQRGLYGREMGDYT